jgi:hypothetical protein
VHFTLKVKCTFCFNLPTFCLSCKSPTPNADDTFTITRYSRNWGLLLRCAACGRNKSSFLSKQQTSSLPADLKNSEVGTPVTKEDYESKHGGILPLAVLLPQIFGGIGAASAVAGTTAGAVIEKQKADETARHNKELESIARGTGIHNNKNNEDKIGRKITKYVDFLSKHGFGFYS